MDVILHGVISFPDATSYVTSHEILGPNEVPGRN